MSRFRTYKQRMDALDILTGDTVAIARAMAKKICDDIFDDAQLPTLKPIAFLSTKEIFKAVDDEG